MAVALLAGRHQTGLARRWQARKIAGDVFHCLLSRSCSGAPSSAAQAIGNRRADCTITACPRVAPRTTGTAGLQPVAKAEREEILRMAEKLVGKVSEFKDGDRRIVFLGDHEIGVFRENGAFYAYSNYCLHQGGPACEGLTIAKVEERIMPDKTSKGLYFSDTELHFVCPWHGYEYDLKTGECVSDRRLRLRKYEVIEKGDEVYVRA
jgi:nitrite reductase/ring-hydroxylating ferredoxin subunit